MGDMELQIFADRLKELRQKLNVTQKDFAEKIGITAAALSSYENNLKNPSIAVAKRIAEVFGVSIDWLCGLTDKKTYNDEIETYGDGIRLLLKLENAFDISLSYDWIKLESFQTLDCVAAISFGNDKMQDFIREWGKMKKIHDDSTIDDEVYNLWIEKTLKNYDAFPAIGKEWKDNPPPKANLKA